MHDMHHALNVSCPSPNGLIGPSALEPRSHPVSRLVICSACRSAVASPKWNSGSGATTAAPAPAADVRAAASAPPRIIMLRKGQRHMT